MDWKGIWKKAGVIFCLLAAASFLLSAAGSSESIVKELISRRIDVMDGYFSGQSTYKLRADSFLKKTKKVLKIFLEQTLKRFWIIKSAKWR